jgi:hypothetical protein
MAVLELVSIDAWAATMAQAWFLDGGGHDRLTIGGLSGGWASQIEVYQALRELAYKTVYGTSPDRDTSFLSDLKRRGWDRMIRWLGLRFVSASAPQSGRPAPVAIISEIPTPSMLDPLVAVLIELGTAAVPIAADPRAVAVLRRARIGRPLGAWMDSRSLFRALRKGAREFDARWNEIERDPPEMHLGGRDLAAEAIPILRKLLRRRTAWLPAEAAAIEACLRAVQPHSIVLASDQHRLGRVAVQVARTLGIKTIVVQHGLPQDRIGYVPVVADQVACWSAHSRDWFVRHGTDRGRLVITGSPILEGPLQSTNPTTVPSILCLLSPASSSLNERLTHMTLDAARQLKWPVTVKLHPGFRAWGAVRDVISDNRGTVRVRVMHREPLMPLIDEAAVVVLHRSTTALQALARRKPVVVVSDPAAGSFAEVDAPMLELPTVRTSGELVEALADLASLHAVDEYFRLRARWLEYVLGPTDGLSATRIAWMALPSGPAAG